MAKDEIEVDESRVKFIRSGAEYYDYYNLPNSDEGSEELGVESRYNGGGGESFNRNGDLFGSFASSKGIGNGGTGTGFGGSGLGGHSASGLGGLNVRGNKMAQRKRRLMKMRRKRMREKMRLKRLKQQLLQERQLLQEQQLINSLQQEGLQDFQHDLHAKGHNQGHNHVRDHDQYEDGFPATTGVRSRAPAATAAALVQQTGFESMRRQRNDGFEEAVEDTVASRFDSGLRYNFADHHEDDVIDNSADRSARVSGFGTSPRRMGLGSGIGASAGLGTTGLGAIGLSGLGAAGLGGTGLGATGLGTLGGLGSGLGGAKFDNGQIGSRRRKTGRGRLGGGGGRVGGGLGAAKLSGLSAAGIGASSGLGGGAGLGTGLGTGYGTGLSGLGASGVGGLSGSGLGSSGLRGNGLNRLGGSGGLGLGGSGLGGGLTGLGGSGGGLSRGSGYGHSGHGHGGHGHSGLGGPVIVLRKKGGDQVYDGFFDDITNNLFGNGTLNYETFAALIAVASVIAGIVIVNAINNAGKRKKRNLSDDMFAVSSFLEFVHKGKTGIVAGFQSKCCVQNQKNRKRS